MDDSVQGAEIRYNYLPHPEERWRVVKWSPRLKVLAGRVVQATGQFESTHRHHIRVHWGFRAFVDDDYERHRKRRRHRLEVLDRERQWLRSGKQPVDHQKQF